MLNSKLVLQAEASECGLACIAMVANSYGNWIGLRELRQRFSISLKGASLGQLMQIASTLNLQTRPLRLEIDELEQLRLPCILHWDMSHYVVLTKVKSHKIEILDPAMGRRIVPINEVASRFTGVALEIWPTGNFNKEAPSSGIKISQLTGKIFGLRRSLSLLFLLSFVVQVFLLISPFFMQWVVDQVLMTSDASLLLVIALGFGLLTILQVATSWVRGRFLLSLSTRLGFQWGQNVFGHLMKLPLDYFEKRHMGDIVSRMGAVQTIQKTVTNSFVEAIIDGLMATATLTMMFVYSWKLAAVTLLVIAVYAVTRLLTYRPLREGTERQLVAGARQQSYFLEAIRGIQVVKVAAKENHVQSNYANDMARTVNTELWLARFGLNITSFNQVIFGVERIVVIYLGALLCMSSVFTIGMLVAYLAYKDQFSGRVIALIDKATEFRMLKLHGERLADIVLTPVETDELEYWEHRKPDSISIEVENIWYRYADDEPWILQDCSFAIMNGESVALTGPSGEGKTTLLKILLGLLKPTMGEIKINGKTLSQAGLRNYRNWMSGVMQDDQLFSGTIAENIAYGEDVVDMNKVVRSAERASIASEIDRMPMGYHSLIGDMGTTLSGGQKQRIVLARALYKEPIILFLDEATSHLDQFNEAFVNDAIGKLNITKVLVAHRRETIESADRTLILSGGRVISAPT